MSTTKDKLARINATEAEFMAVLKAMKEKRLLEKRAS